MAGVLNLITNLTTIIQVMQTNMNTDGCGGRGSRGVEAVVEDMAFVLVVGITIPTITITITITTIQKIHLAVTQGGIVPIQVILLVEWGMQPH